MEENLHKQVPFSEIMSVFQNILWNAQVILNEVLFRSN